MKEALKWILITIGILVCGVFLLAVFIIVMLFDSLGSDVKPDFIAYESKVPLAGWSVTEVVKKNGANNGKFKPSFKQTYSSGVVLTQTEREEGPEPQTVGCANRDKPANRLPGDLYIHDCTRNSIKGGGAYTINKVSRRDGTLERVEVRAAIGEAWMYFHIPEEEEAHVSEFTEWQSYFDSMEPVDLNPNRPSNVLNRVIKFLTFQQ